MITTVTLNTAIDKTYYLSGLSFDKVNRVQRQEDEPGGKGVNVAKVIHTYNIPVTASGFVGGFNGQYITSKLESRDIYHNFVYVKGESRCCLNIIDEKNSIQTEIIESGPTISIEEWGQMKKKIESVSLLSSCIIFSGSIPKGLGSNAYAELIKIAKANGAKVFLDTSGEALKNSIEAIPFFMKPNEDEVKTYLGKDKLTDLEIFQIMNQWSDKGIELIVVSRGEKGAYVSYKGKKYSAVPPKLKAVNPVGCGDALVAGFAMGIYNQMPILDMIKFAIGVSAAAALEKTAGSICTENVLKLTNQVSVFELEYS